MTGLIKELFLRLPYVHKNIDLMIIVVLSVCSICHGSRMESLKKTTSERSQLEGIDETFFDRFNLEYALVYAMSFGCQFIYCSSPCMIIQFRLKFFSGERGPKMFALS